MHHKAILQGLAILVRPRLPRRERWCAKNVRLLAPPLLPDADYPPIVGRAGIAYCPQRRNRTDILSCVQLNTQVSGSDPITTHGLLHLKLLTSTCLKATSPNSSLVQDAYQSPSTHPSFVDIETLIFMYVVRMMID